MLSLKNAATGAALAIMLAGGVALAQTTPPAEIMGLAATPAQAPMTGEHAQPMWRGHHSGMGMPFEHVEGRIAFLKAELKIDAAQSVPWTAFADVLRSNAKAMGDMHAKMKEANKAVALPDIIDMHEKLMAAHLDLLHKFHAALTPLYAVFNDEQKKVADSLIKEMCAM